jgi:hypothetical protein
LKVGADLRASHKTAGFVQARAKRQNNDSERIAKLLAVPRYADILEDNDSVEEERGQSKLVKSHGVWRTEMKKWIEQEARNSWADDDSEDDTLANAMYGQKRSKWLPRSLDLLFGEVKDVGVDEQTRRTRRRQAYSEEARLMELLADEEADEDPIPDDGELEGSGDDFEY